MAAGPLLLVLFLLAAVGFRPSDATLTISSMDISQPYYATVGLDFDAIFTDSGLANGTTIFIWDFGNSQNSTIRPPLQSARTAYVYDSPGVYTVTITITDPSTGEKASYSETINVTNPVPIVSLFATVVDHIVDFTAVVENPLPPDYPTQYFWNFGDPTNATNSSTLDSNNNITHFYPLSGTYIGHVQVKYGNFLSDYTPSSPFVIPIDNPVIVSTSFPSTAQVFTPTNFSVVATNVAGVWDLLNYTWTFSNSAGVQATSSTPLPYFVYNFTSIGPFTVQVVVSQAEGGVAQVATGQINITSPSPVIVAAGIVSPVPICSPIALSATVSDPSGPYLTFTYNWLYNDPVQGPIVVGSFSVTGSPTLSANLTYPPIACVPGNYSLNLTLVDSLGLHATWPTPVPFVVVNTRPVVTSLNISGYGTALPSPAGATVTILGSASNPGGTYDPLSFIWNFGDGTNTTTTATNTTNHNYLCAGTYTITLYVSDKYNLTSLPVSISHKVSKAVLAISDTSGIPSQTQAFLPSTFTVGVTDAAFACEVVTVNFTFVPTVPSAPYASVLTQILNTTQTYTTVTVTFLNPQVYTVIITATNADYTATSTSTVNVVDVSPVIVSPTNATICQQPFYEGSSFLFNASATSAAGTYTTLSYFWSFVYGDPGAFTASATGPVVTQTFTHVQPVTISLSVVDGFGGFQNQTFVTCQIQDVAPTVTTIACLPANCTVPVGTPISLFVTATDPALAWENLTYSWNFEDGSPLSNLENTTHTYMIPTMFNVSLQVSDGFLTSSAFILVNITDIAPVITALLPIDPVNAVIEQGMNASFSATASSINQNLTYSWMDTGLSPENSFIVNDPFVPATNLDFPNATKTFYAAGVYNITVVVSDLFGLYTVFNTTLTVVDIAPTLISSSVSSGTQLSGVVLDAVATDPGLTYDALTYAWVFDEATSDARYYNTSAPTVTYYCLDVGSHSASVVVVDSSGLTSNTSAPQSFDVTRSPPYITTSAGFADGTYPLSLTLFVNASAPDCNPDTLVWTWSFVALPGNSPAATYTLAGGTLSTTSTQQVVFNHRGVWNVSVFVTDSYNMTSSTFSHLVNVSGCAPVINNVSLPVSGASAPFYYAPTSGTDVNETVPLIFQANVTTCGGTLDVLTYTWNFGDGYFNPAPTTVVNSSVAGYTYFLPGTYFVTLTVLNQDGLYAATAPYPVVVRNIVPVIVSQVITPTAEGKAMPIVVTAADGPCDELVFTWSFVGPPTGYQGPFTLTSRVVIPGCSAQLSQRTVTGHLPTYNAGLYNLTLTVTDPFGGSATLQTTFLVDNTPPTFNDLARGVVTANGLPAYEGTNVTWTIAATAHGFYSTVFYQWVFSFQPGQVYTGSAVTVYQPNYFPCNVTVTLSDANSASFPPGTTTATFSLSVLDVAPVAYIDWPPSSSANGSAVFQLGTNITLFKAHATDPGTPYETLTYFWDFGDNSPQFVSTSADAVVWHLYQQVGLYNVTLVVSDGLLNGTRVAAGQPIAITILPPTGLNITEVYPLGVNVTVPALFNYVVDLSNRIFETLTYTWTFGDGSALLVYSYNVPNPAAFVAPTINHTYFVPGSYSVVLNVSTQGNLYNYYSVQQVVLDVPPVITSSAIASSPNGPITEGTPVQFAVNATHVAGTYETLTYTWSFANQNQPAWSFTSVVSGSGVLSIPVFPAEGNYTIVVAVTDMYGTASTPLSITNSPQSFVVLNAPPSVVAVSPGSDAVTTQNLSTTFTVTAVDFLRPNQTSAPLTFVWTVSPSVPQPLSPVTTAQPSVALSFPIPGSYNITVVAVDADGASSSPFTIYNITVLDLPPAVTLTIATPPPYVDFAPMLFVAQASDAGGTFDPLSYSWNFGDGTVTAALPNAATVNHTYQSAGTIVATVTVFDSFGQQSSASLSFSMVDQPASISMTQQPNPAYTTDNITFTFSASGPGLFTPSPLVVSWSFPFDGSSGTGNTVTKNFPQPGSYSVIATVSQYFLGSGAVVNTTMPFTFSSNAVPPAIIGGISYSPAAPTQRYPAVFTVYAVPQLLYPNNTLLYSWSFGDGVFVPAQVNNGSIAHTFLSASLCCPFANVTVTVSNAYGSAVTLSSLINVTLVDPVINYTGSTPQYVSFFDSTNFTFTVSAQAAPGGALPLVYSWDFGDGGAGINLSGTSASSSVTYRFASPGVYHVVATVTNNPAVESRGVSTLNIVANVTNYGPVITGPIVVLPAATPIYEHSPVTFSVNAFDGAVTAVLSYQWFVNDAYAAPPTFPTNATTITYTYARFQTTNVTVVVTNQFGGTASAFVLLNVLHVNPVIVSATSPPTAVDGTVVQLSAVAVASSTTEVLTYTWSFGGFVSPVRTTQATVNVTYHPSSFGMAFAPNLTVTDPDGGYASMTFPSIVILNTPPTFLSPNISVTTISSGFGVIPLAMGTLLQFNTTVADQYTNAVLTYTWFFGDATPPSPPSPSPVANHTYAFYGVYAVSVVVTDQTGALSFANATLTVAETTPFIQSASVPATAPQGPIVVSVAAFEYGYTDNLQYQWLFNNQWYNGSQVTLTNGDFGVYNATVVITDNFNGPLSVLRKTYQINVTNVPPSLLSFVATTVPPLTIQQGGSVSFQAVATDFSMDTLSFVWNFFDRPATPPTVVPSAAPSTTVTITHTFYLAGSFQASVYVQDNNGGVSPTLSLAAPGVVVTNVPPSVTMNFAGVSATASLPITLNVSVTDPGLPVEILTYTWQFPTSVGGPVNTVVITNSPSITITFLQSGVYSISLVVTDEGGGSSGILTQQLVVADIPPSIRSCSGVAGAEGSASFFSVDAFSPLGTYDTLMYAWSFGDGVNRTVSSPAVNHSYATCGEYTVVVTVFDQTGLSAVTTCPSSLTVPNVAPVITNVVFTANASLLVAGSGIVFTPTVVDPGVAAMAENLTFTWNFGDGTPLLVTKQTSVSHAFHQAPMTFTVTVTANDGTARTCNSSNSQSSFYSFTVAIADTPPILGAISYVIAGSSSPGSVQPAEGDRLIFTVQTTLTNYLDTLTYHWSFGDGNSSIIVNSSQAIHSYLEGGQSYVVTVQASNGDVTGNPFSNTATLQIFVAYAPVVVSVTVTGSSGVANRGNRGAPVVFTVQAYAGALGLADQLFFTWSFGDGADSPLAPLVNGTGEVVHTYAAANVYTYVVTLIDPDDAGAPATAKSGQFSAMEVCPTAVILSPSSPLAVAAAQSFVLQGVADFSNPLCAALTSSPNFVNIVPSFSWFTDANLNLPSGTPLFTSILPVPSYSVVAPATTVTLQVCYQAIPCSQTSLPVSVLRSNIVVAFSGGNSFDIAAPSTLVIDSAPSFDPADPNPVFVYAWTCTFNGGAPCASSDPAGTNTSKYVVAALQQSGYPAGQYYISVVIRNVRAGLASVGTGAVTVSINWPFAPSASPPISTVSINVVTAANPPLAAAVVAQQGLYSRTPGTYLMLQAAPSVPAQVVSYVWSVGGLPLVTTSLTGPTLNISLGDIPAALSTLTVQVTAVLTFATSYPITASKQISFVQPLPSSSSSSSVVTVSSTPPPAATSTSGGSLNANYYVSLGGFVTNNVAQPACTGQPACNAMFLFTFSIAVGVIPPANSGGAAASNLLYPLTFPVLLPQSAGVLTLRLPPSTYIPPSVDSNPVSVYATATDLFGSSVTVRAPSVQVAFDYYNVQNKDVATGLSVAQSLLTQLNAAISQTSSQNLDLASQLLVQVDALLDYIVATPAAFSGATAAQALQLTQLRNSLVTSAASFVNILLGTGSNGATAATTIAGNLDRMSVIMRVATSFTPAAAVVTSSGSVSVPLCLSLAAINVGVATLKSFGSVNTFNTPFSPATITAVVDSYGFLFSNLAAQPSVSGTRRRGQGATTAEMAQASASLVQTIISSIAFNSNLNPLASAPCSVSPLGVVLTSAVEIVQGSFEVFGDNISPSSFLNGVAVVPIQFSGAVVTLTGPTGSIPSCQTVGVLYSTENVFNWAVPSSMTSQISKGSVATSSTFVQTGASITFTIGVQSAPGTEKSCQSWDAGALAWSTSNCILSPAVDVSTTLHVGDSVTCACLAPSLSIAVFQTAANGFTMAPHSLSPSRSHSAKHGSGGGSTNSQGSSAGVNKLAAEIVVPIIFVLCCILLLVLLLLVRKRREKEKKRQMWQRKALDKEPYLYADASNAAMLNDPRKDRDLSRLPIRYPAYGSNIRDADPRIPIYLQGYYQPQAGPEMEVPMYPLVTSSPRENQVRYYPSHVASSFRNAPGGEEYLVDVNNIVNRNNSQNYSDINRNAPDVDYFRQENPLAPPSHASILTRSRSSRLPPVNGGNNNSVDTNSNGSNSSGYFNNLV